MHVFISHHSSDSKFAAELRELLVAAGMDVWNPETQLEPGSNWLKEAGRALERADAIVFILSKRALSSRSIQREINFALTTKRLANRVYPVVIDNEIDVPWILRDIGVIKTQGSAKIVAGRIRRLLDESHASRSALAAGLYRAKAIRSKAKKPPKAQSVPKRPRVSL